MAEPHKDTSLAALADVASVDPGSLLDYGFNNCDYRYLWEQHIAEQLADAKYDMYRLTTVPSAVGDQIATSLDTSLPSRDPRRLRLGQPCYGIACNREQLERMLRCLAVQNALVGFAKPFAELCAAVLAVMGDEKKSFKLVLSLSERLQLKDYHELWCDGALGSLQHDVHLVCHYVKSVWPGIPAVFAKHHLSHHLHGYIEALLKTGLTAAFNPRRQPFSRFIPLLHRLITAKPCTEDPRKGLRYIVACIVASHCGVVEDMATAEELRAFCDSQLQVGMPVKYGLLSLIDHNLDYTQMAMTFASSYASLGFCAGSLLGLTIGEFSKTSLTPVGVVISKTGWVGSLSAAKLSAISSAGATGMCVGGSLGGIVCFCYGYTSCLSFVRTMASELLSLHDVDDDLEEIGSPKPSSHGQTEDGDAAEEYDLFGDLEPSSGQ